MSANIAVKSSASLNNATNKGKGFDKTLSKIINFGTVIAFFGIAIIIYWYFFSGKRITKFECFENQYITIYETAIAQTFGSFPRLICNITATPTNNVCIIDGESYVKYNFPVHMIKLLNGNILAVFNDGRLYKKDSMQNTMWQGPINNSLPNDSIPLRMVTLAPDMVTLLGIGYDNQLYIKSADDKGHVNLTAAWKQVPNNTDIIYIIFDNETGNMISIDKNGKLFIKTSSDYTSNNVELITMIDRPLLRLYFDNNGYMLALDDSFDLYQFSELNWKNSPLNIQRGHNDSKIQDILYDNDGKLFGLIFNTKASFLQIMKQDMAFYLANFIPLDQLLSSGNSNISDGSSDSPNASSEFVLSDKDIFKSKIGNIDKYLSKLVQDDSNDDDTNIAYQKMILQTRADLKKFCATRGSNAIDENGAFDNYDLLAQVESNDSKINNLKDIMNDLLIYEPDKARIIEKYPIIQKTN
jgi:hypothetical protein